MKRKTISCIFFDLQIARNDGILCQMEIDAVSPASFTGLSSLEKRGRDATLHNPQKSDSSDTGGRIEVKKANGFDKSFLPVANTDNENTADKQNGLKNSTDSFHQTSTLEKKELFLNLQIKSATVALSQANTKTPEDKPVEIPKDTSQQQGVGVESKTQKTNDPDTQETVEQKLDEDKRKEESRKQALLVEQQKQERRKVEQELEEKRVEERKRFFEKLQHELSNTSDRQNQALVIGKHANVRA